MKNINFSLIFFVVIFSFFFIFCDKVQALTISPARIEVSGDPGSIITKDITLFNDNTSKEETFYVSYSNFEAQGETGSPLFVEPKGDLGTWMNTDESVILKANESKTIKLTINIPADAYPGGHFAVVFLGNNPNEQVGGQVSVGAKMGVLILLSVNGDVLEAGGLSYFNTKDNKFFYNSLPVPFEYRWKNDGDDRIKPTGYITIRNIFFIPTVRLDANSVSGNILPHSTRLFTTEWIKYKSTQKEIVGDSFIKNYFRQVSYQWKNFALGPYFAKIDLVHGSEDFHSVENLFFFVLPWQLLIVILFILLIVFFIGKKLLKKYNENIIRKAGLGIAFKKDPDHV